MGWGQGIGIGWPNATSGGVLPLETYLIADCLSNFDPKWTQYLPTGTLQLGQRVPTTSSTVTPFYGTVIEIGTEFGDLVAELVVPAYGCAITSIINLSFSSEESGIYDINASLSSGSAINEFVSGHFNINARIYYVDNNTGREFDEPYNTSVPFGDFFNIGTTILCTWEAPLPSDCSVVGQQLGIGDVIINMAWTYYSDTGTSDTITENNDLWRWNYPVY